MPLAIKNCKTKNDIHAHGLSQQYDKQPVKLEIW